MFIGAVLAGGQSSRMGRDKASLVLGGASLLQRAQVLLGDAGAARIHVVGRGALPNGIPDLLPHCGPPGGVHSMLEFLAGREELDGGPLLFVPVDMPLLRPSTLRRLLEAAGKDGSAHYTGEVFPCVLRASEALHTHLAALFAEASTPGGERSMKGILRFQQARAIAADGVDEVEFLNVNTPEEWVRLEKLVAR